MNENNTLFDDDNLKESEIEGPVVKYGRRKGFMVEKFNSPHKRSVPDDIFTRGIFHFFIEFKAPGEKPTAAQARDHKKRTATGQLVFVVDDIEKGEKIVDRMWDYYRTNFMSYSEI